jgi:hypothetical protein
MKVRIINENVHAVKNQHGFIPPKGSVVMDQEKADEFVKAFVSPKGSKPLRIEPIKD